MARHRWPRWVYSSGEEPDYRFSFANERTFLAWIRTAVALLAAGVALDQVSIGLGAQVERALAVLVVTLGLLCAVASWLRWARSEKAMRERAALPSLTLGLVLTMGLVLAAALLLLLVL